ncbi:secreted protein containing DUF1791 [Rhodopirellula baltica SH28]|uniref:Secreted protein containing DUF1791 n=1 Tax=Rhodopirellula baltica SH28 TaxID=993517 RepID=K5DPI4_RHOBT|nr:DsrE family protein [Rhodopirellula baltica]EKK04393.1 secreted protein containing DUF1791 [Rhodopirellula baltica SH28]
MNRMIGLMTLWCLTFLVSVPGFAQENAGDAQPDVRRGPGFGQGPRAGRGPEGGQGLGRGRGMRNGQGFGRGANGTEANRAAAEQHGHDDRHDSDHEVFQFLLQNHEAIQRTVKELASGVETLTESDDPKIAEAIQEHVEWMEYRIEETNPIRMRDPLFAEIFRHTDKIKMVHENTEKGVRVTETSDDAYVVKLIQAHAKAVSGFVERGFAEAMKNHPVPERSGDSDVHEKQSFEATTPVIAGVGKVVRLPSAVQQPKVGAKLLVDLTSGAEPGKINPGLERVAKYLNIYAGAGELPTEVQIAVVIHGGATLTVLNSDAYAAKFGTESNPNLELMHQLHEAGVDMYVCGQSLIASGAKPNEVVVFVDTAVSALTAVVNLQSDGFAYVPVSK